MQYLKNLPTQLSHSLWVRSHREPNQQRDFSSSDSNISVISRSDPAPPYSTRFSTSSSVVDIPANSPRSSQQGNKNKERKTNGGTTTTTTTTTPVVPHFLDVDSILNTTNHNDEDDDNDILAAVVTSSSKSSNNNNTSSCSGGNNNNGSNNKELSTVEINSGNTFPGYSSSSSYHHHNRVYSSITRRDRRDGCLDDDLIRASFQQSSKRRNSSGAALVQTPYEPVILSLTPLSAVRKQYLKENGNKSGGSGSIGVGGIVSIFQTSGSSSIAAVKGELTTPTTEKFGKNDEFWEKINSGEHRLKGSEHREKEGQTENLGGNRDHHYREESARKYRGLLRGAVDDPLRVHWEESSNGRESAEGSNREETGDDENKKKIEKGQKSRPSKNNNTDDGIDGVEVLEGAFVSSGTKGSSTTPGSSNTSISNIDGSCGGESNNRIFVITSNPETGNLSRASSSLLTSSSVRQGSGDPGFHEIGVAEPWSGEQSQVLAFVDKKLDRTSNVSTETRGSQVNGKVNTTPRKSGKRVRSSSVGVSDICSGTSTSSLLWGREEATTLVGQKVSREETYPDRRIKEISRQVHSCRERGERENEKVSSTAREAEWYKYIIQEKLPFSPCSPTTRSVFSTGGGKSASASFSVAGTRSTEGETLTTTATTAAAASASAETTKARGTSQDQSSPSSSSRLTTFTRDRPCSSLTNSSHSTSTSTTLFGSPVSSLSDLGSEPGSKPVRNEENSKNNNFTAPVVVFSPFCSTLSSLESSVGSSTYPQYKTVLPVVNNKDPSSKGNEVQSSSRRVYQKNKNSNSYNYSTNYSSSSSGGSSIVSSEQSPEKTHSSSLIQSLFCINGFNFLLSPKKLLSLIFYRRQTSTSRRSHQHKQERRRLSLSFSPSCASLSARKSGSTSSTKNSSSTPSRKFNKRKGRRRRDILKISNQIANRGPTKTELRLWATMDHEDLIRELPQIEKLSNQERLRLAHKRRMLQLKKFQQYEKDLNSNSKKHRIDSDLVRRNLPGKHNNINGGRKGSRRIRFRNSIMLLEAAGRNDVEEVRLLLESGVDPDVANEDGLTALHQCCIDDNEEMMKQLLDFGANVNAEDSEKWTPLHAAATCGHLHLVQYLIARGANLLSVNAEGNMPYDICDDETTLDYIESEMAKRGVTQELIEEIRALPETSMLKEIQRVHAQGGDLEIRDVDGATPLHIASANGYYRVAEFLLDNHAATDVQDKDFWQPIHAAACWGHLDVLELLVQNGADLDARTKNNETPYAICEDPEIKERIIQLRTEQQSKRQNEGRKRPSRTHSTNSRTQSIRRTSQRDKGLTSKRDAADEAQMLRGREEPHKENSPSPTVDGTGANKNASANGTAAPTAMNGNVVNGGGGHNPLSSDSKSNIQSNGNGNTSSEDDPDFVIPPHLIGRDSVGNMKMKQEEMNRLREIAVKSGAAVNHNNQLNNHLHHNNTNSAASSNGGVKVNNLLYSEQQTNGSLMKNQNNIQKNLNNSGGGVAVLSSPDDNGNLLPKPEINPSVDSKVPVGGGGLGLASGMALSGSRDNLMGVSSSAGNSTIDIHVSVTINTNSPVSTLTNGGSLGTPNTGHGQSNGNGPHSIPVSPGGTIFTPPGTLSDLKKQRSLIRTSSNPLTNGTLTNLIALPILPTGAPTTAPTFQTFKPPAPPPASSSPAASLASETTTITPSILKTTTCYPTDLVPLSPTALLLQNNHKNSLIPTSLPNSSQSSPSSWHYYWNDWRNGYTYSQSQFDSSVFSSGAANTAAPLPFSNEYPSHSPSAQHKQQHLDLGNSNNKKASNGVVGGVPVLPTSATLFPLGSYYFNSSVGSGVADGGNNSSGGGGGGGGVVAYNSSASSCCSNPTSNLGGSSTTNTNNNPFSNNQHCCYLNNLTGGMNDAMSKYHPPASPTMSLRRYVGDPAETVGDYGDGGKRCCVIV